MADPQIRSGNVIIERAEFTKSHGCAPSRATIQTIIPAGYNIDSILWLIIGTSQWMGRCTDVRDLKNESTGLTTQVTAVDFRDDLFSVTIFGQINMLDRETGKIYSIIEGVPNPDTEYSGSGSTTGLAGLKGQFSQQLREDITAFRTKLRNDLNQWRNDIYNNGGDASQITYMDLVPEFFRSADPNGYILQTPYYGRVPVGTLIQWLAGTCGFKVEYSPESQERISQSDSSSWENARWNVFNLDWMTGTKVANALTQVLDALGLQVTMRMDWTRTLYVTRIGEVQYPGLIWEGVYATETEDGEALQDDADTGVWVVGDRDLYEFTDLPYEPDWNQKWNEVFWDLGGLKELADTISIDLRTARLRDFPEDYQEWAGEYEKHLNGSKINDMLATEYLKTVPYRLYRVKGMDKVLTLPEEYSGETTPREIPISTPLLSDPNKQAILKSHWVDEEQLATLYVQRVTELSEQEKGWTLIESTGQIWFDDPRFQYASTVDGKMFDELLPDDILPEDGTITVVFYGPVYRRFFGTNKRVGSQSVSGLRRGYILSDSEDDIANATEYVPDGERSADTTAEDIAAAYLARPRIVRSGSETFIGTAGHEVTGEIQRTTVSVDESSGIRETVQYANDEPSPAYDPQIELRRRLAEKDLKKVTARMSSDRRDNKLKALYAAADKVDPNQRMSGKEQRTKWMMKISKATFSECQNVERKTDDGMYYAGNPVIGEPVALDGTTERTYRTIATASVTENDERVVGVAAHSGDGHLMVATAGCYPAYVKGPVTRGDALKFSKTDWCFIKGDSGIVLAEEDYETATAVRKMVRIGGGAGGSTALMFAYAATTTNISLTGSLVLVDGIWSSQIDGKDIAVWLQTNPLENGIYTCRWDAVLGTQLTLKNSFSDADQGVLISIGFGTIYAQSMLMVGKANTLLPYSIGAVICQGGTTVNDSLSGTASRDGVTPVVGRLWCVKNQTSTAQNGIYIVQSGSWARVMKFSSTDLDGSTMNLTLGKQILLQGGALQGGTLWIVSATNTATPVYGWAK
jgi:hypothetical protein